MVIENIMYFALGLLVAGLVALIILPAVWKRAVRLTKRRIEAATPITMAEFRADKDQLRAEFALSTRRLEMNVETLRKRLAEQLSDVNQKRSDLGMLKTERNQHLAVVRELEEREAELRSRTTELEREATDLAQRLRMRDRELDTRNDEDANRLTSALAIEQNRATFLEDQARSLIARLESSDRRSAESTAAIAQMRDALAGLNDDKSADADSLTAAEARMASAEQRLNALLAETAQTVDKASERTEQLLADKLGLEAEVEQLRQKVANVESTLLEDWDTERMEEAHLRERLNDIASSVSRLLYAVDTEAPVARPSEESLFDRVQRFADDGVGSDMLPVKPPKGDRKGGSVSDRMAALREIQGR